MNVLRRHPTLLAFVVAALAACGALAWVTAHALRLEREQRSARTQAVIQERIRLALWRMDSTVGAILSREAARPYFVYQPFYPAERAYTKMLEPVHGGEVLVPSPLLAAPDRFVRLHFQIGADGAFTSPQAPAGNLRDLAEASYVPRGAVEAAVQRLGRLAEVLGESRNLVRREGQASPGRVELSDAVVSYIENALQGARPDAQALDALARSPELQTQMVMKQSADEYRARQALSTQNAAPQFEIGQQVWSSKSDAAQVAEPAPVRNQSALGTPRAGEKVEEKTELARPAEPGSDGKKAPVPPVAAPADRPTPHVREAGAVESSSAPAASPAPVQAKELHDHDANRARALVEDKATASPAPKEEVEKDRAGPATAAPLARSSVVHDDLSLGSQAAGTLESQVQVGAFEARWVGAAPAPAEALPAGGAPRPVGLGHAGGGELVFMRDVAAGEALIRQGFWVDWPALRGELLRGVRDLLPRAQLHPLSVADDKASPAELGRRLASFPADLDPGAVPGVPGAGWSPLRITLGVSWGGMLLALGAIATVLHAATDLAERRGRFVSAVTHELRTPLTTFCLYSQMLADGMVPEGEAKMEYLRTLRRESSRLAGIVETVLDYARLSPRNRPQRRGGDARGLLVDELLERVAPALAQRVAQSGMSLVLASSVPAGSTARADAGSVERILANLVDNSCKYAVNAHDKRIEVSARLEGSHLIIRVGDHGPGIAPLDRQRIFKAFERGTPQGDGSIPGLGLGLALAQGLARDMGGRLSLVQAQPAAFELELPASRG